MSSKAITVQSGSVSQPYQMAGSTVTLTANSAPISGQPFGKWVVVSGSGSFASASASSTTFTVGSADATVAATFAPTAPGSLGYTSNGTVSVGLNWGGSSDDGGVVAYDVYRVSSGTSVLIGSVTGTSFTDSHLRAGATYGYYACARDSVGNATPSNSVIVNVSANADQNGNGIADAIDSLMGVSGDPVNDSAVNLKVHRPLQ